MVVDRLTGVSRLDRSVIATGPPLVFSSGATKPTTAARELVLGIVGVTGGWQNPTWASSWTPTKALGAGSSYLGRAWQAPANTGTFTATGFATGFWAATVLTFMP
jgi:hypothetical protein